jgi:hypothetical protein
MRTVDFAKLFDLFQKLDPETVALFTKFAQTAMSASEGPNEFVKNALRKVIPLEQVKVTVTRG